MRPAGAFARIVSLDDVPIAGGRLVGGEPEQRFERNMAIEARRADIPLEWVAMRCAAQNHVVNGSLERCIVVPAVTEVCRPHSRHSCKRGRLFSPTTRRLPQPGHTKPSGQRCLNKKAAQLSSSENDFLNSASDRALAISTHPRDRANPIAQHTTSRQT